MPERDLHAERAEERMKCIMTDEEMIDAAKRDVDARPLSDRMLAKANAQHRLDRSKARRAAAARALLREAAELATPEGFAGRK